VEDIVNTLLATEKIWKPGDIAIVVFAVTFKLAFVVNPVIAIPLRAFARDDATVITFPAIDATKYAVLAANPGVPATNARGVIELPITNPEDSESVNEVEVTDNKVIGTSPKLLVGLVLLLIVNIRFVEASTFTLEASCGSIHIIGSKSDGLNCFLYN
jgi:hypothetical protein